MSKELKLRPEVYWFAQQMERKLREHDDRPGWHGENEEYLFYRLCEEVQELKDFLQQWWGTSNEWSECRLIDEAADVANFAMMLSDNARNAPIPPIAPDPEKQELVDVGRNLLAELERLGYYEYSSIKRAKAVLHKHEKERG